MIKSTKVSTKFLNSGKKDSLESFIEEYRKIVIQFVDILWEQTKVQKFVDSDIVLRPTWLSARAIQCAGKQASGIVRGTRVKQERRLWQINKFLENKEYKKARKLQFIYLKTKVSKPNINNIECELDSRFVKINLDNETSFDGWLSLTSLGKHLKLKLPFKRHKHFNKLISSGPLKTGVRLSNNNITMMFDIPDAAERDEGLTLGIDIGQKTTLSCSDDQCLDVDNHGYTYSTICKKLSRKVKGSKNFQQTIKHRTNYLGYIVNKLDLTGVKIVNRENIRDLRKHAHTSRNLQHWNYAELFELLDNKFIETGVQLNKVNPTYTSQRCSVCGWVRKGNRKGKKFKCTQCSFECDADLNASRNLSFTLVSITKQERLQHKNKIGFYWNVVDEVPIVPHAQKVNLIDKCQ